MDGSPIPVKKTRYRSLFFSVMPIVSKRQETDDVRIRLHVDHT